MGVKRGPPAQSTAARTEVDVLCLVGGTPQVLTELLWALHAHRFRVRRVTVLTTRKVWNFPVRKRALISSSEKLGTKPVRVRPGERLKALYEALDEAMPALFAHFLPADDVGDPDDNYRVGEAIAASVRSCRREAAERRLVACLSGGRKSMSAWLMLGMALHQGSDDWLVHVTVSEALEKLGDKFWYPTHAAQQVSLSRLPIPSVTETLSVETERRIELRGDRLLLGGREFNPQSEVAALLTYYATLSRGGAKEVKWEASGSCPHLDELERLGVAVDRGPGRVRFIENLHHRVKNELSQHHGDIAAALRRARKGHVYSWPGSLARFLVPAV